jgi:cytochrome c556
MTLFSWGSRLAGVACAAILVQSFAVAPLTAQTDVVAERSAAMKAIGDQMKVFVPIAKGEQPFDAAKVKAAADIVLTELTRAETLFPAGSTGGRALPAIWEKPEEFAQGFENAKKAAADLAAATSKDQFDVAFKAMGGTCGACHQTYRKPEN